MLVHLVATLALVLVACLTSWAAFHRLGRPMPRYLLPMTAGTVAIAYGVYAEYTWGSRTAAALPDSFVVLQRIDERSALSPWSWVLPRTVRLSAIDGAAVRRHPAHPELRLLEVFLLERFHPTRRVAQLVDCLGGRRADLAAARVFSADGLPDGLDWRVVGTDDDVVREACAAPANGARGSARDDSGRAARSGGRVGSRVGSRATCRATCRAT